MQQSFKVNDYPPLEVNVTVPSHFLFPPEVGVLNQHQYFHLLASACQCAALLPFPNLPPPTSKLPFLLEEW